MTELSVLHYARLEAIPRPILEKRRQTEMLGIENALRAGQTCDFKILVLREDNLLIARSLEFGLAVDKEDNLLIARSLEFGLTADDEFIEEIKQDLIDIIQTQVNYCFENDNLDNLFKTPASLELWMKFWSREAEESYKPLSSQKIIYNYKK